MSTLLTEAEDYIGCGVILRVAVGPCAVGEPVHVRNLMRENREIPWLPVPLTTGRAAQGRLRP